MQGTAAAPHAPRVVTALLAVAEERALAAALTIDVVGLTVIELPEHRAAVAVVERGLSAADEVRARLDRLLAAHQTGVLFVVLAGGNAADRALLEAADRDAPDPRQIGLYLHDGQGQLGRVCGRRLALLGAVGARLGSGAPLDPAKIPDLLAGIRRAHEEALRFAVSLERQPHHITRALGAACIIYYGLSVYWGRAGAEVLIRMGANGAGIVRGEPWRLLTHAFLHSPSLDPTGFSLLSLHLLVNLLGLLSFGGFLEAVLGARRYFVLYVLGALGGGIASALVGHIPLSVGASGALWALMAAGIAVLYQRQALVPRAVTARLRPRLVGMLVVNALISFIPQIDKFAHAGGALVGFLLTGVLVLGLKPPSPPPADNGRAGAAGSSLAPRDPLPLRLIAAALAATLATSIAMALWKGRPWETGIKVTDEDPSGEMVRRSHPRFGEPTDVSAGGAAPSGGV